MIVTISINSLPIILINLLSCQKIYLVATCFAHFQMLFSVREKVFNLILGSNSLLSVAWRWAKMLIQSLLIQKLGLAFRLMSASKVYFYANFKAWKRNYAAPTYLWNKGSFKNIYKRNEVCRLDKYTKFCVENMHAKYYEYIKDFLLNPLLQLSYL